MIIRANNDFFWNEPELFVEAFGQNSLRDSFGTRSLSEDTFVEELSETMSYEDEASVAQWLSGIGQGAASGAASGAAAGPWGALVGGLVGAGLGAAQTAMQPRRSSTTSSNVAKPASTARPTAPPTAHMSPKVNPQLPRSAPGQELPSDNARLSQLLDQIGALVPVLTALSAQLGRIVEIASSEPLQKAASISADTSDARADQRMDPEDLPQYPAGEVREVNWPGDAGGEWIDNEDRSISDKTG
ncbi:hypothetical protein [Pseudarthrobacter sp. DSP2-3-2b1]|uniref:hypothetical protein n=1 Tax=Pseudarthrobacter sp. DSP2-3-2b1 TaxID=2804661 RepID=UPI003CF40FBC